MNLPSLEERFPPANQSNWRVLLDLALPAIQHVFPNARKSGREPDWTLGGGTALAMTLEHRISYDIDIFVKGESLRRFVPGSQPGANPHALAISSKFQWPGHYVKFERPEGEVDFLSSALLTESGFVPYAYKGHEISIEKPEEIIIKKIRYRAARFTPRDVFDLVSAERGYGYGGIAKAIATYTPDLINDLADVISNLRYPGNATIAPTPEFEDVLKTGKEEALVIVENARRMVDRQTALNTKETDSPALIRRSHKPGGKDDDGPIR